MKNGPAVQPTPRAVTTTLGKRAMAKKVYRDRSVPPSHPSYGPIFIRDQSGSGQKGKGQVALLWRMG